MTECVVSHGTDKAGRPKRAEAVVSSHLCRNHEKRLREWLSDIAVDYVLLETRARPGSKSGERSAQGFESAAPMNLTVAALRDSGRGLEPRERGDELWYELPDIPAVLSVLHARAEDIRCELDPSRDGDYDVKDKTVTGEVNYLIAAFNALVAVDWIDEAFTEIKQVWIALQRAHDRPRPRPIGPCLTHDCDGTVWPRPDAPPWCSKCRRVYEANPEIIKVRLEAERAKEKKPA